MNYKMTWMKMEHRQATALVAIAALASVLVVGSTVEIGQLAFAYKSFSKGKRAVEQPTKINQNTVCFTAGGNSPIDASCTNTANIGTTNTGGIGGVRGGMGDNGGISQSNSIDQKVTCETAGGNSGTQGSCINAGGSTSNTGGSASNSGSTSNTGGSASNSGSTSNTGGSASNTDITTSIKLPFGGF